MTESSGKFKALDKETPLPEKELEVIRYWEEHKISRRSRSRRCDKKFGFTEGPPTANGLPHIGHVLTRVVKDVYLRYKTMDGYQVVPNIAGWDTHGLPVEIEVEKELGIENKEELMDYGLEKFNSLCKESVFRYEKNWRKMSERIGFWIDYDKAYITMDDNYIESVWWSLKEHWKNGLLEKGHYVVPYCPRCGTPLSSHEVAQGYRQVEDPSIYIRFKLKDEDAYFLAWTTTPWTLISNLMLAVGEDIDYALVSYRGEKYYLAERLVEKVFDNTELLNIVKGSELVGKEYRPLFDFVVPEGKSHYVTSADFVSLEEGTGIVHIAPAFGQEDHELCTAEGVSLVNPVDEAGRFMEEVTAYKNRFVKDADPYIMEDLETRGDLIKAAKVTHTYPFCWRCDSPLLYYALESWFIRTSGEKERLIANNEEVFWKPEHLKHGRFGNFLDELKDWALSRNRFWGTPLPVWVCDNGHEICIGSKEELTSLATAPLEPDFELHRPWVDRVELECPECKENMKRVEYVIDCWYDSGSAPFAQFHYPFENEDMFDEAFPVDFITEALDQTRGWFYSLLAINSLLFNKPAYLKCLTLGLVLDEDGEKMSKTKGNAVDPVNVMDDIGADATRLYFLASPVWKSTRFSEELAREKISKTINTLVNIVSFFTSNANLDDFHPSEYEPTNDLDRWLLSKKNTLVKDVRDGLDELEFHRSTRALEDFVEVLSNWYLRASRRRFWEGSEEEKASAYNTLYETLDTLTLLMAPFTPFLTERVYRNIIMPVRGEPESVHLLEYPEANESLINCEIESHMDTVIKITELGRNARQQKDIKLRQPLKEMVVVSHSDDVKDAVEGLADLLKNELNIRDIRVMQDDSDLLVSVSSPNYSSLGPKFKGEASTVAEEIENADASRLKKSLETDGKAILGSYTILPEDVVFEDKVKEGYAGSGDSGLDVFVNVTLDEELLTEGMARDVVRRIQTMRKELDLGYTQEIHTRYSGESELEEAIGASKDYIMKETLSRTLDKGDVDGYEKEWDIDGNQLSISIEPID